MKAYDESAIQTLKGLEHIRLRLGMYIGRKGDGSDYMDGIYILLKEVFDNAIDEFISGFGRKVELTVDEKSVTCRDYGRGIPLGKLRDCVSELNTGGKFNNDVFQFSVGMNGVGTKAVNALSSKFLARSVRDGQFAQVEFERGLLVNETKGRTDERRRSSRATGSGRSSSSAASASPPTSTPASRSTSTASPSAPTTACWT